MFDDLKIRNKLVCLVAGPIMIIVALAALGAEARQDNAADSRRVENLVAVARADSDVVDALQAEALAGTAFVAGGRTGGTEALAEARKGTDEALEESLGLLAGSAQGTSSGFRSASRLAVDAADKLQYIRQAVDQGYRWDQVATTYASLEQTFLAVNETVSEAITDPRVAGQLRTAGALASYKAAIARQGSLLVGASEQGGFEAEGSYDLLGAAVADEESERAIFTSIAETGRKGEVRDALASGARIDLEAARDRAVVAGAEGAGPADTAEVNTATATVLGDLHGVETDLFDAVIAQSKAASSDASRSANWFLIAAVVAILAAAVGAVLLGRRITRPLDTLTVAANQLATVQMPRLVESLRNPSEDELDQQLGHLEAIEVSSNDEIGQLASSFNDVQRVAGEVAAEQAALLRKGIGEMFVNLARRNQALLDRQIEFIDELERGEEDPDQLENLYRLDHLATRMRRNAESLLVLAGAEPPRRRGRPAPLANVVRAALAEVEDFARIELLSFDEVLVASNAAADLAHLLSELMENAANFSPPETKVEVVGHRTNAGGYVISVSDHGIGMSVDQIAEANDSLAKPPLVGLALSRSLGFIVVGRLAGRHGITVRTMPSPAGGLTAVVSLPAALVTDAPSLGGAPTPPAPELEIPRHLEPVVEPSGPPVWSAAPSSGPPSTSSSSVPPLEFTPYDASRPAPASLAEAVPTGQAFDLGLDALVAPAPPSPLPSLFPTSPPTPPSGPTRHADNGNGTGTGEANGLPTRRLRATPASAQPTPADRTEPPEAGPAPSRAGSTKEDGGRAPATDPVGDDAVARDREPVAADAALPEALEFAAPTNPPSGDAALPDAHLDGRAPAAPTLPSRERPGRPVPEKKVEAGTDTTSRPAFLAETEPPRLPGRATSASASTENGSAPPPAEPTRLFGSAVAPTSAAPVPPASSTPVTPPDAATSSATASGGARTSAGLAKRVPRGSGTARAIPGSDAERGVGATRRSPDEVRSLLSSYRAGQQRARVDAPAPAEPTEEMQDHE